MTKEGKEMIKQGRKLLAKIKKAIKNEEMYLIFFAGKYKQILAISRMSSIEKKEAFEFCKQMLYNLMNDDEQKESNNT